MNDPPSDMQHRNPVHPAVTMTPPPYANDRLDYSQSQVSSTNLEARRRSYDDSVQPIHPILDQRSGLPPLQSNARPSTSQGLTNTFRPERGRHIYGGLVLPAGTDNSTISPISITFSDHTSTHPSSPSGPVSPRSDAQPIGRQGLAPVSTSQEISTDGYQSLSLVEEMPRSELFSVVTEQDQTINLKILPSRSREPSRSPSPAISRQSDDVNGQSHPRINGNRMSLTSNRSIEGRESLVSSRSTSPHHRVDVPRSVEDGSDSETSGDGRPTLDQHHLSSAPSDNDNFDIHSPLSEDASVPSQHDASDDLSESSPVERTSHATFIAPALPPIRFSLNTTDFAELLSSVQGNKLKSLDQMTTVLQESDGPSTPKASHGSSEKDLTAVIPQAKTADEPKQLHLQQSFSKLLPEERQTLNMYVAKADTFTHLNCLYGNE